MDVQELFDQPTRRFRLSMSEDEAQLFLQWVKEGPPGLTGVEIATVGIHLSQGSLVVAEDVYVRLYSHFAANPEYQQLKLPALDSFC